MNKIKKVFIWNVKIKFNFRNRNLFCFIFAEILKRGKMSYSSINDLDTYNDILEKEDAVLVYFSHEQCNVCKFLKPKIAELLENNFPKMKMYYADTVLNPEISGQNKIFSVPTVLAFFGGRESFRKSRSIGINELAEQIERPYGMIFKN